MVADEICITKELLQFSTESENLKKIFLKMLMEDEEMQLRGKKYCDDIGDTNLRKLIEKLLL